MAVVYKITSKQNNTVYIGRGTSFNERRKAHLSQLRNHKHRNKALQRDFITFGEDNFTFEVIIDNLTDKLAKIKEIDVIMQLSSKVYLYNNVPQFINQTPDDIEAHHIRFIKAHQQSVKRLKKLDIDTLIGMYYKASGIRHIDDVSPELKEKAEQSARRIKYSV